MVELTQVCVNIYRELKKHGVKHKQVADALGMSRVQFCDMIRGRKIIRAEWIPTIARAIGCSIEDLFQKM